MISVQKLSKSFGPFVAVDDVSFEVGRGEVLGFLGPNGAGKSTTMKMITGFIAPSAGRAVVCGHDIETAPVPAKRTIGYLPEGAPSYGDMTPAGFLGFVAAIRGYDGAERARRVGLAVERARLDEVLEQPIDTLSKGYKRRVGLAQAILHDPPVLILDEPTDGLDPNQKHEVRLLIEAMAPDKAIVISTHLLEEVEAVCSRAIVIARGRIVADGTPDALVARSHWHNAVTVVLGRDPAAAAAGLLGRLAEVDGVETAPLLDEAGTGHIRVTAFARERRPILETVAGTLREAEITPVEIRVERGRLDDVFRAVTTA